MVSESNNQVITISYIPSRERSSDCSSDKVDCTATSGSDEEQFNTSVFSLASVDSTSVDLLSESNDVPMTGDSEAALHVSIEKCTLSVLASVITLASI